MGFWNRIEDSSDIFLVSEEHSLTFTQFKYLVESFNSKFEGIKRSVCILLMDNTSYSVAAYVSCLQMKIIPLLINVDTPDNVVNELIYNFKPSSVIQGNNVKYIENYELVDNHDLGLLLSTSGTTGTSKYVAISYDSLQSNADSICNYLEITRQDRAYCTMPLSYSYGLSIVNSHINKKASVVLTNLSPFDIKFVENFEQNMCTNISGVPFLHEVLLRTGFYKKNYSSLRFITQAGGYLKERFKKKILEYSKINDVNFFVMYGQTEATARISYVPPESLQYKLTSIGIPIPSGKLSLSIDNEILYTGPNIMMGYVNNYSDFNSLSQLDVLHTGDTGYVDSDGYFYITGRLKRYIKITGFRYSLDEIERLLSEKLNLDIVVDGDEDILKIYALESIDSLFLNKLLQNSFKINSNYVKFYQLSKFPLTKNGKIDYKNLLG